MGEGNVSAAVGGAGSKASLDSLALGVWAGLRVAEALTSCSFVDAAQRCARKMAWVTTSGDAAGLCGACTPRDGALEYPDSPDATLSVSEPWWCVLRRHARCRCREAALAASLSLSCVLDPEELQSEALSSKSLPSETSGSSPHPVWSAPTELGLGGMGGRVRPRAASYCSSNTRWNASCATGAWPVCHLTIPSPPSRALQRHQPRKATKNKGHRNVPGSPERPTPHAHAACPWWQACCGRAWRRK